MVARLLKKMMLRMLGMAVLGFIVLGVVLTGLFGLTLIRGSESPSQARDNITPDGLKFNDSAPPIPSAVPGNPQGPEPGEIDA